RANTGVSVGQLAGIGLGISDELFEVLCRHRWMHRKRQRYDCQASNRIEILDRIIEWPALEQALVDMREGPAEENGIAVRAGVGDSGSTQRTAAAADVFDEHRAEQRFDLLHPWPGKRVERATRRKWNHEPDRSHRIGFCACNARDGQSGNPGDQLQKLSAAKFHFESSPLRPFLQSPRRAAGYGRYVFAPAGRRTINTEPLPSSLVTVTSPPIRRASLRVMAR